MFIDGSQQTFASGNGSIGNVTSSENGNMVQQMGQDTFTMEKLMVYQFGVMNLI